MKLGKLQSKYRCLGEEKNILPQLDIEPQIAQPAAHSKLMYKDTKSNTHTHTQSHTHTHTHTHTPECGAVVDQLNPADGAVLVSSLGSDVAVWPVAGCRSAVRADLSSFCIFKKNKSR